MATYELDKLMSDVLAIRDHGPISISLGLSYRLEGFGPAEDCTTFSIVNATDLHIKDLLRQFQNFATDVMTYKLEEGDMFAVLDKYGNLKWKAADII